MPITAYEAVARSLGSQAVRKYVLGAKGSQYTLDGIIAGLAKAQLYDVDNVVHWLDRAELTLKTVHKLLLDLPSVGPPYPYTYLEWTDEVLRASAFVISPSVFNVYTGMDDETRAINVMVFDTHPGHLAGREARFLGSTMAYVRRDGRVLSRTTDDGRTLPAIQGHLPQEYEEAFKTNDEIREVLTNQYSTASAVAMFAFALMNCHNVVARDVDPRTDLTRQQIRERERKKQPFHVYKVLEIDPLRPSSKRERAEVANARTVRLHGVAGHFGEYGINPDTGEQFRFPNGTPKGKLFGRLSGRFWFNDTDRGSLDAGMVSKVYRLAEPPAKGERSRDVAKVVSLLTTGR